MPRGRDHQAPLDLEKTIATASGVAAHLGARGKAAKVDAAKAAKVVAVAVAEVTTKVHTGRRITKAAKAASTEARKAARTARAVVVAAAVAEMVAAAVATLAFYHGSGARIKRRGKGEEKKGSFRGFICDVVRGFSRGTPPTTPDRHLPTETTP